VSYSFLGRIPFHSFPGDSVIRVAVPVQSNRLAVAPTRRRLEGQLCPQTILKKGW
jgi:hypothetical protein